MPEIARFYGIVIKMYFKQADHNPPHFHAISGDCMGAFDIQTGKMIEGDLPKRAIKMVQEWATKYRSELMTIWETQKFIELPPLI